MNCLAEARFIEILDRGGLDATRPDERIHLEACEACRESWAAVAAAGEVLAEARPKAARGRLVPVMIAAAMLVTIVGVIVWKSSATPVEKPRDPIVMLLEGTPEDVRSARESLLKQGKKAIPGLIAARPKLKGSARLSALQDLIFDLKRAGVQDPEAAEVFDKMAKMKFDLQYENITVEGLLSFLGDLSGLKFYVDPKDRGSVVDTFDMKNSSIREILDVLCALKDLDFDFRYGVVYVTTPLRLWSTDPAVGLPTKNQWETQVLAGDDLVLAGQLTTRRITMDMQNAPLSTVLEYFSELFGQKFQADAALSEQPISVKISDLRLSNLLQLLTLPAGWDARIENGMMIVSERRR